MRKTISPPRLKRFLVTCGLGRMGNHHTTSMHVLATDAEDAAVRGRMMFRTLIDAHLEGDPILNKTVTVTDLVEEAP